MKIVFVNDNGFSENDSKYYYNSANIQHYNTVTSIFEEVTIIARKSAHESFENLIPKKYPVHLVDSPFSNLMNLPLNLRKLNKILDDKIKNCDVVICFGFNGYFAHRKARKYNKPTIVYIGGCVYDTLKNMDSRVKRIMAPLMSSMIKDMSKHADYIHYVDEYLLDRYPSNAKTLICPSAKVDIDYEAIKKRTTRDYNAEDEFIIGLIGYTHNKIKGIDTAIKSLQVLGENYKLQIVGRGDYTWLMNLASSLGVENQVEFLGVLDRDEIFGWLDKLDLYIQPSITEGVPRATIEAMSRACPVISSHAGGLKKLIDSDYRIIAGDFANLARKIQMIKNNPDLMLECSKRNFEKAKEFDFPILNRKRKLFYEEIYKELSN